MTVTLENSQTALATAVIHTGLSICLAIILFIPITLLVGFLATVLDAVKETFTGNNNEGIGFVLRGFQYYVASALTLIIPFKFLKKGNAVVAASIYGTLICLVFVSLMIVAYISHPQLTAKEWFEMIASGVGAIAGIVYFAFEERN